MSARWKATVAKALGPIVRWALEASGGCIAGAARELGLSQQALRLWMRRIGIQPDEYRGPERRRNPR